jgi:hypothetical protein
MKKIICLTCFFISAFLIQTTAFSAPNSLGQGESRTGFKDNFKESQWNSSSKNFESSGDSNATFRNDEQIGQDSPISDGIYVLLLSSVIYGVYLRRRTKQNCDC